jgi:lipopolysaccharide/colanic/teichoic acid biosynthesis glycosyltransferase
VSAERDERSGVRALPTKPLKILLIGGTGFVGRQLAPVLAIRGHHITVASRNPDPVSSIVGSENWNDAIDDADVVALLSVINNDVGQSDDNIQAVNVDLPLKILELVSKNSNQQLILFGSDHADAVPSSVYARTKSELVARMRVEATSAVTVLILSPVHGVRFVKKLAVVDRLPLPLRAIAVAAFGAIRPLTHIERIADAIETSAARKVDTPLFLKVVDDQSKNFVYNAATRFFDLCFASTVLILFGWLMLVIATLVSVTSAGPALFQQQRVGRQGRAFMCLKFRTMHVDTPQVATHHVAANATTKIGKFLRVWKLDELPQIFNIFANQMSLVGPRPCLPSQHDLITARHRLGVLDVKPGVTGWSQINGVDMSDPERLARLDADYCLRRSIPFYLKISLLTFIGKGQGDKVRFPSDTD